MNAQLDISQNKALLWLMAIAQVYVREQTTIANL